MSADKWAICPKCRKRELLKICDAQDELNDAYGKIPANQFLSRQHAITTMVQQYSPDSTLREDYEIYMSNEGEFSIKYACRCTACDFRFEHKYTEQIDIA